MTKFTFTFCLIFALAIVGSFSFPDFTDAVSGRLYQASLVFEKLSNRLDVAAVYESISDPSTKYIGVIEGMRKEEIAQLCQKKLNWTPIQESAFAGQLECSTNNDEGSLLPGSYVVDDQSSPRDMKIEMQSRFDEAVRQKINDLGGDPNKIDINTVTTVASIIQREAAGKRDMKVISGIIWNRLADNMPLQVDATLQYAKGKDGRWWPSILSKDKFIDSPFNTYQNKGLPPTAISNPGIAAIEAALDPEKTSCIFYLHDKYGRIHCSDTYEEHKKNVNKYLKNFN